jgi:hypothetical protein
MRAIIVAVIYFGSFVALGSIAKIALARWMRRRDLDLVEVQAQAGAHRGKRRVFLLGFWRDEGPD